MAVTVKIGLLAKDTYQNLHMLGGANSNNNYTSLQNPVGTFWQTTLGKVLRCASISYTSDTVRTFISLGYGDTSVNDSVTPPTNPVTVVDMLPVANANVVYHQDIWFLVPSEKFPFVFSTGGGSNVIVFGFEED